MPIVKLKKALKWLYPFHLEKRYRQFLLKEIDRWETDIRNLLIPNLGVWVAEEKARDERKDVWAEDLNSVMIELRSTIGRRAEAFLKGELSLISGDTSSFNKREWSKAVKTVLGIDLVRNEPWLKDQLIKWIDENTNLIRKLSSETLDNIQNIVSSGVTQGQRVETIASRILSDRKFKSLKVSPFDTSVSALRKARRRAKLIADDQIGKFNSQLTERRQGDLGIKRYRWRNVGDRRVRGNPAGLYPNATPSHWDREGKIYKWDDPPAGGHPGYDIRCRCWAEPVFEDVVDMKESTPSRTVLKAKPSIDKTVKNK